MKLRVFLAVAACKLSRRLLNLLGRGGTALPGKIAMRLCPGLIGELAKGLDVIIVTGTNGKTTTSQMLRQMFADAQLPCVSNNSGANLLSGVTAELAFAASLSGRQRAKHAVIECDEAALKLVTRHVKAKVIVVTNVFRDQLDRFGEVTNTRDAIAEGIANCPEATLCLNADCSMTASLAEPGKQRVLFYGMGEGVPGATAPELSDAMRCLRCGGAYSYDWHSFGHLGAYRCEGCGFKRPTPDYAAAALVLGADGSDFTLLSGDTETAIHVGLPAVYNTYNALAALAGAEAMGIARCSAVHSLAVVQSGFGRMERFKLPEGEATMILVKNPAGCDRAIEFISACQESFSLVICLSDRTADGTDVSWIWDSDFERLLQSPMLTDVTVGGLRAEDMRLRLKYAGAEESEISLTHDMAALTEDIAARKGRVFIIPTYTAMLKLRDLLSVKCGGGKYWK